MARRRSKTTATQRRPAAADPATTQPAINGTRPARAATKLEHAILDDGRSKREISLIARIPEVKFGKITKGAPATTREQRAIAAALHRSVASLFGIVAAVVSG